MAESCILMFGLKDWQSFKSYFACPLDVKLKYTETILAFWLKETAFAGIFYNQYGTYQVLGVCLTYSRRSWL